MKLIYDVILQKLYMFFICFTYTFLLWNIMFFNNKTILLIYFF